MDGTYIGTTYMGDRPVINIDLYNRGVSRNGTKVTVNLGYKLRAINGASYWGYGVYVSWGWSYNGWHQGAEQYIKQTSTSQWNDTEGYFSIDNFDTGTYNSGSMQLTYTVYAPNNYAWGTATSPWIDFNASYTNPVRGNVTLSPTKPGAVDNRFEALNITWDNFKNGTGNPIASYEIWRQEYDGSTWRTRSGIEQVWSSNTSGTYTWSGLTKYPMYYIKNKATGRYIDVNDGILENNQLINTHPFNGTIGQRFSLEDNGQRVYIHVDDSFSHMMHVQGSSTANATRIVVFKYTATDNSRWRFDKNSDGTYRIVPFHATDKCLDEDVATHHLIIYSHSDADNQKWILEDASDAWRNLEHRFNVVAIGTVDDTYSNLNDYPWAGRKNDRPTKPSNLTTTPNQVNIAQPISLQWTASSDTQLRSTNTYEIEFERSRNGGAYQKVGNSVYSNKNALANYTGYNTYAQPGDLFRYRIRGYDYFDIISDWSAYSTFEVRKSGINYLSSGTWKGHYAYAVVNGQWTMCEIYTVKNNQWTMCIMA